MKMKSLTLVGLALAVALFFLGRFTAPKLTTDNSKKIDSLNARIKAGEYLAKVHTDSINYWKKEAKDTYLAALKNQNPKIIYKQIRNETVKNILSANDSVLRAMFIARHPDSIPGRPIDAH